MLKHITRAIKWKNLAITNARWRQMFNKYLQCLSEGAETTYHNHKAVVQNYKSSSPFLSRIFTEDFSRTFYVKIPIFKNIEAETDTK